MWNCGPGMMGTWGLLSGLFGLVIIGLIVVGIVLLVRRLDTHTSTLVPASAEQILAERYARGEIDEQEYQQRLAILRAK